MMTFSEAKRKLPKFAKGLTVGVTSLLDLRVAVQQEIDTSYKGDNPLTEGQLEDLQLWLATVRKNY